MKVRSQAGGLRIVGAKRRPPPGTHKINVKVQTSYAHAQSENEMERKEDRACAKGKKADFLGKHGDVGLEKEMKINHHQGGFKSWFSFRSIAAIAVGVIGGVYIWQPLFIDYFTKEKQKQVKRGKHNVNVLIHPVDLNPSFDAPCICTFDTPCICFQMAPNSKYGKTLIGWRYAAFVGALVGAIGITIYPIIIAPMQNPEPWKAISNEARKNINQAEIQPGNMKVWSDPFDRPEKKK